MSKFWGGDSDSEPEEDENEFSEEREEKKPTGASKYMDSDDEFVDDAKRVVKSAKAKRAELLNELTSTLKTAIDDKSFSELSDGAIASFVRRSARLLALAAARRKL